MKMQYYDEATEALFIACSSLSGAAARSALARGAQINARDVFGCTPLSRAVSCGRQACLAELIAAGADVDLPCYHGRTPIMAAAMAGQQRCAEMLIHAGANLQALDEQGYSAGALAKAMQRPELVRLLEGLVLARQEARLIDEASAGTEPLSGESQKCQLRM